MESEIRAAVEGSYLDVASLRAVEGGYRINISREQIEDGCASILRDKLPLDWTATVDQHGIAIYPEGATVPSAACRRCHTYCAGDCASH